MRANHEETKNTNYRTFHGGKGGHDMAGVIFMQGAPVESLFIGRDAQGLRGV
jgi:hypothetical protein